jgi:lipopolysaccharide biosynthesis glycosyltransferase
LPEALGHTIDIALHNHEKLTFVDQCALNIAFQGRFAVLPGECNTFLRPNDDLQFVAAKPVVLHYLEQPKPWDPGYPSINCQRWITDFAALSQIVEPDRLNRLLAVQFKRAGARRAAVTRRSRTRTNPMPAATAD